MDNYHFSVYSVKGATHLPCTKWWTVTGLIFLAFVLL